MAHDAMAYASMYCNRYAGKQPTLKVTGAKFRQLQGLDDFCSQFLFAMKTRVDINGLVFTGRRLLSYIVCRDY